MIGSTRNFIPINYQEVFSLLITLDQHLPAFQSLYQIIFSVTEYLILKLDKLFLTAVSFLKSEENVFPANFVTP